MNNQLYRDTNSYEKYSRYVRAQSSAPGSARGYSSPQTDRGNFLAFL